MYKIRAIYVGDVKHSKCYVFEFNEKKERFEMIANRELSYSIKDIVMNDDWKIFKVEYKNGTEGTVVEIDKFKFRKILRNIR